MTADMRDGETQSLLCRVDQRLCALPLAGVVETIRPLPVEPVAGAPAFVLGLSVVRGVPTPIVDAARLLGGSGGAPKRVVILKVGERRVGLAVDAVLGLDRIGASSLQALPPLLRNGETEGVSALGTLDSELLIVLQAVRLVPESLLAALETKALAS